MSNLHRVSQIRILTIISGAFVHAIVTHLTAALFVLVLPLLKSKGPAAEVVAADPLPPPPPPPPPPAALVAAAPLPSPKLTRALPVMEANVSLLSCPIGCIRSKGIDLPNELRSTKLATMIGPKNSSMNEMRRTKYNTAKRMTRLFLRRDCLIE